MASASGRLAFAAQFVFKRLGRALLVPIYRHMSSKSSVMSEELKMALKWWLQTLEQGMCEVRAAHAVSLTCANNFVWVWICIFCAGKDVADECLGASATAVRC